MAAQVSKTNITLPAAGRRESPDVFHDVQVQRRLDHNNARHANNNERIAATAIATDTNTFSSCYRRPLLSQYNSFIRRSISPCSSIESDSSGDSSFTSTTRGRRRFRKRQPKRQEAPIVRSEVIFLGICEIIVHHKAERRFSQDDQSLSSVSVTSSQW